MQYFAKHIRVKISMKDFYSSLFAFLILAVSVFNLHGQNSEPNILLIIADDMGIDATPGYLEALDCQAHQI